MSKFFVFDHPIITHKLAIMRDKNTCTKDFRELLTETTILMAYEATKDTKTVDVEIETPICKMKTKMVADAPVLVPILRAGLGMVDGFLKVMPNAKVGHLGMYRDEETHIPVPYYSNLPSDIAERPVFLIDPMIATGGSILDALDHLTKAGCKDIRVVGLVAAPQGIKAVQAKYPDIDIYAGALDEGLNERAYIVPGLGDAGDRIFGTF